MSFESTTQNGQNGQKGAEGKDGRAPRSLTLTFAETNPWEMLVRDRLAALPRGYLKRFLLLLLEGSGMDLANEAVFQEQVEKLLLTKNLAVALGSVGAVSRSIPSAQNALARSFKVDDEVRMAQTINEAAPASDEVIPENVDRISQAVRVAQADHIDQATQRGVQQSGTLPASMRQPQQSFKDGGFGALEL